MVGKQRIKKTQLISSRQGERKHQKKEKEGMEKIKVKTKQLKEIIYQ